MGQGIETERGRGDERERRKIGEGGRERGRREGGLIGESDSSRGREEGEGKW